MSVHQRVLVECFQEISKNCQQVCRDLRPLKFHLRQSSLRIVVSFQVLERTQVRYCLLTNCCVEGIGGDVDDHFRSLPFSAFFSSGKNLVSCKCCCVAIVVNRRKFC
jgi:hypothetical protein